MPARLIPEAQQQRRNLYFSFTASTPIATAFLRPPF
jgi:hypothetical protein